MIRKSPSFSARRHRLAIVVGLVTFLVLSGTGLANAVWTAATTTTGTVTAGALSAGLTGTAALGAAGIDTENYTTPTEIVLHNTSTVPLDYGLSVVSDSGTLDPAIVELALWEPPSGTCPAEVPTTGVTTRTLAEPLVLPAAATAGAGGSSIPLCAATRIAPGRLFGTADQSLSTTPSLAGRLSGTNWNVVVQGAAFAHTVASAPASVTNVLCEDEATLLLFPDGIGLTWTGVTGATAYEVRSSTGATLTTVTEPAAELSSDTDPGPHVQVVAVGPTGESGAVEHVVHVDSIAGLRCGPA